MKFFKIAFVVLMLLLLTGCATTRIAKGMGKGKTLAFGYITSPNEFAMQIWGIALKQVEPPVPDDKAYWHCSIYRGTTFYKFLPPGKYRLASVTRGNGDVITRYKIEAAENNQDLITVADGGLSYMGAYRFQISSSGFNTSNAIIDIMDHPSEDFSLSMVLENTDPDAEVAEIMTKRLNYLNEVNERNNKVQGVEE